MDIKNNQTDCIAAFENFLESNDLQKFLLTLQEIEMRIILDYMDKNGDNAEQPRKNLILTFEDTHVAFSIESIEKSLSNKIYGGDNLKRYMELAVKFPERLKLYFSPWLHINRFGLEQCVILEQQDWKEPTTKDYPTYIEKHKDRNKKDKHSFEDMHYIWRNYRPNKNL